MRRGAIVCRPDTACWARSVNARLISFMLQPQWKYSENMHSELKKVEVTKLTYMNTLKLQSNGPLYSNTVIGTLAVNGWDVIFGTARRGLGGLRLRPVSSCNSHPSMASVPNFILFDVALWLPLNSKGLTCRNGQHTDWCVCWPMTFA